MAKTSWVKRILGVIFTLGSGGGMAVAPVPHIPSFGGDLFVSSDGMLVALSSEGLIRSENAGEQWLILNQRNGWLIAQKDRLLEVKKPSVFSSGDWGLSWRLEGTLEEVPWADSSYMTDERGWLYLCHDGALVMSPDGGVSWKKHYPPKGCRIARVREGVLYVLAEDAVQLSRDGGLTWQITKVVSDEASRKVMGNAVLLLVTKGSRARLLVYTSDRKFFLSENGGRSWREHGFGFSPDEKFRVVAHTPGGYDVVYFVREQTLTHDKQMVYSTSDGISYTRLGLPYSSYPWRLVRSSNGTLYVVDHFYVYSSTDNGITWKRLGRGGITPKGYEKLPSLLPHD